jgi:hypothetical protein
MVDRHLEALDRGSVEGRRWPKLVTTWPNLAAQEEEERADMWGSHVSDKEERRWSGPKAQAHEGNVF